MVDHYCFRNCDKIPAEKLKISHQTAGQHSPLLWELSSLPFTCRKKPNITGIVWCVRKAQCSQKHLFWPWVELQRLTDLPFTAVIETFPPSLDWDQAGPVRWFICNEIFFYDLRSSYWASPVTSTELFLCLSGLSKQSRAEQSREALHTTCV